MMVLSCEQTRMELGRKVKKKLALGSVVVVRET